MANPIPASNTILPLRRPVAFQHGDGVNVETVTGNVTLTMRSAQVQKINGGASDRDVTLPAPSLSDAIGHWYRLYNAGATNNLVFKTSAGSTLATLLPDQWADVEHGPTNYVLVAKGGAGAGGSDFGAPGLLTDQIGESTGAANITMLNLAVMAAGLRINDSQAIKFGTPGTDVVMTADGTDMVVTGTGDVVIGDNVDLKVGTGKDLGLRHDGSHSYVESTTGNLIIDNQNATGFTKIDLGSDTTATGLQVRNNSGTVLFQINGAGAIVGGVDMWATAPSKASGSVTTIEFFDDFNGATFDASNWVVTEDDAACTQAVGDALGGELTLTCKAATDDNACQVQWAQETFRLTSGKKLWVEFRIKSASGDMTNSDWFIGLAEAEDLTGVADNMPANGIGFHKDDGAATFKASSSDGGTDIESVAAAGTIVDATYIRLGLLFDGGASGAATITPYVDGVAGTALPAITYATMAEMSATLMVRNGDGVTTQTLVCDYVKVVQER